MDEESPACAHKGKPTQKIRAILGDRHQVNPLRCDVIRRLTQTLRARPFPMPCSVAPAARAEGGIDAL